MTDTAGYELLAARVETLRVVEPPSSPPVKEEPKTGIPAIVGEFIAKYYEHGKRISHDEATRLLELISCAYDPVTGTTYGFNLNPCKHELTPSIKGLMLIAASLRYENKDSLEMLRGICKITSKLDARTDKTLKHKWAALALVYYAHEHINSVAGKCLRQCKILRGNYKHYEKAYKAQEDAFVAHIADGMMTMSIPEWTHTEVSTYVRRACVNNLKHFVDKELDELLAAYY